MNPNLIYFMKNNLIALSLLVAFVSTATVNAHAQDVYLGAGLPGLATIGYAAPMGKSWGLRADYAGGLNASLDGSRDGVNFTGNVKYSALGAYADWFPFDGGFRLVGGVRLTDAKVDLSATGSGNAVINGVNVNMAGEYYNVTIKMPSAMPYVGIGYGHQRSEPGLGFYFDIGVTIGTPEVSSSTSLVTSGQVTQADVNAQTQKLRDSIGGVGYIPSASMGVVYRF